MKNLVVTFPGIRGCEIPLLYFGAKYYEDKGYEKIFVGHPPLDELDFEGLYEDARKQLQTVDFTRYDKVVFVAKSMGTVVAGRIKEAFQIPATMIMLTPIEETIPYIRGDNDIALIAAGSKDRYLATAKLEEICIKEQIPYYIEPDVGHRMEVKGDLEKDLRVITNVMQHLQSD